MRGHSVRRVLNKNKPLKYNEIFNSKICHAYSSTFMLISSIRKLRFRGLNDFPKIAKLINGGGGESRVNTRYLDLLSSKYKVKRNNEMHMNYYRSNV